MSYFITRGCVGCSLCIKHCPVDAIEGKKKEVHKVNELRCVDCGVCANVCPQNAILDNYKNNTTKLTKDKWLKPEINSTQCSGCSMCVDICKFDCIQISIPKFKGDINNYAVFKDYKNCVGCSMCAETCPLYAIKMKEGE